MSVGAVFAANITSSGHEGGGVSKDLQSMQKSLAIGNTAGAQQAFTQYKKDLPSIGAKKNGVEENPRNSAQNTLKADLQGLQNALAAGDISGAQDAFLKLKRDLSRSEPAPEEEEAADTQNVNHGEVDRDVSALKAAGDESAQSKLDLYA